MHLNFWIILSVVWFCAETVNFAKIAITCFAWKFTFCAILRFCLHYAKNAQLGLFTFLPQCTVHNMRISELGVPVYSSLASSNQWKVWFDLIWFSYPILHRLSYLAQFYSEITWICRISRIRTNTYNYNHAFFEVSILLG